MDCVRHHLISNCVYYEMKFAADYGSTKPLSNPGMNLHVGVAIGIGTLEKRVGHKQAPPS